MAEPFGAYELAMAQLYQTSVNYEILMPGVVAHAFNPRLGRQRQAELQTRLASNSHRVNEECEENSREEGFQAEVPGSLSRIWVN